MQVIVIFLRENLFDIILLLHIGLVLKPRPRRVIANRNTSLIKSRLAHKVLFSRTHVTPIGESPSGGGHAIDDWVSSWIDNEVNLSQIKVGKSIGIRS